MVAERPWYHFGLGADASGAPNVATTGLMQLGRGLLSASTAPRSQRGALMAQAFDPTSMQEAQRRSQYYAMIEKMANPVISEQPTGMSAPVAGGPTPALGGSLVDLPGGGTAPGQVQTAMRAPAAPPAPAVAPRGLLSPQQAELLKLAGPQAGMGLMAQMMQPAKPNYMKGADGFLYDMNTGQRALPGVEAAGPKPTTLAQNMETAGYDLSTPEGQQAMRDAIMKPDTQITLGAKAETPVGKITQDVERGVITPEEGDRLKAKARAYPETQTKAAGFANRMQKADQAMLGLVGAGLDPANIKEQGLAALPGGNFMLSPEFQQYRQAQADWVRAKLRKESGAVIGADEMADEIKTYFPQPGDSPEVQNAKRQARKTATENLVKESQGAYDELFAPKAPPVSASDYEGQTLVSPDGVRWRAVEGKWQKVE